MDLCTLLFSKCLKKKSSNPKQGLSYIWTHVLFGNNLFLILAALRHVKLISLTDPTEKLPGQSLKDFHFSKTDRLR